MHSLLDWMMVVGNLELVIARSTVVQPVNFTYFRFHSGRRYLYRLPGRCRDSNIDSSRPHQYSVQDLVTWVCNTTT
jgi:hypothetical protein